MSYPVKCKRGLKWNSGESFVVLFAELPKVSEPGNQVPRKFQLSQKIFQ